MALARPCTHRLSPLLLAATLVAGLIGISGCGGAEPLGEGVLRTSWQISPRGCDEAGVETVEVALTGEEARTETFDCAAGEGEIEGLAPGNYEVALTGLDKDEHPIFASETAAVTVRADVIAEAPHLRLTALPSQVSVGWRFDDGRLCGPNAVERIEVAVFDEADYEVDRVDFACNAGEGVIGDLTAGTYLVEAVAYSADDQATHRGTAEFDVRRGDEAVVDLVLEPSP